MDGGGSGGLGGFVPPPPGPLPGVVDPGYPGMLGGPVDPGFYPDPMAMGMGMGVPPGPPGYFPPGGAGPGFGMGPPGPMGLGVPPAMGIGRGAPVVAMEWPCPKPGCGNINFARRTECNRCSTPRPAQYGGAGRGRGLADIDVTKAGPKGLFKPGDWACLSCGNINWERRDSCNTCNTLKPTLQDPRTGRGGGYNERQEIASKKAAAAKEIMGGYDSDEYDDFGRKRKRFRGKTATQGSILAKPVQEALNASSRASGSDRRDRDLAASGAFDDAPARGASGRSRSPRRSPPRDTYGGASGGGRGRSRSRSRDRDRDRDRDYGRR